MGSDALIEQALRILDGIPALATRRSEFVALSENSGSDSLHLGVVGVTSSGKSTFINALMGESLLPEEARATTNLLVKCRHGVERLATLHFRDGRPALTLHDSELTRERMAELCSERLNPDNQEQLSRIEWTSPNTCIPPGLVLVDTPGLDAAGYESHQDITLRQFLPLADIVIYMTSIRNPFKAADLEAVGTVLENDQRILFVLSQIDLERDSYEGGELIRSRSDKLERHRFRLKADLAKIKGLHGYGIDLVSSFWAKQAGSDRQGELWKKSRFSGVLERLEELREQLKDVVAESRTARIRVQLERTLRELEQAEPRPGPDSADLEAQRKGRTASLDRMQEDMSTRVQQLVDRMKLLVDQATGLSFETGSKTASQKAFALVEQHFDEVRKTLVAATDREQARLRSDLENVNIQPARTEAARKRLGTTELADVESFVTDEAEVVRTREWFESLFFWPKSETRLVQRFDSEAALRALEGFVLVNRREVRAFLDWWLQYVQGVFLGPIRNELAAERRAERDLERLVQQATEDAHAISVARQAFAALLGEQPPATGIRSVDEGVDELVHESRPPSEIHAGTALVRVISLFRESELSRTLEGMAERIRTSDAPMLAVGCDRSSHLRLLSLLAHDLRLLERLEKVPPTHWIVACEFDLGLLRGPTYQWSGPESLSLGLPIVVAPEDEYLAAVDVGALFADFSGLLVEVDASRIDAGILDLERAPYRHVLTKQPGSVLFTCGNGALFAKNRFRQPMHLGVDQN